jgi:acyl-CoA synthetase (AMP-forming)/AMP-acid ligase II
VNLGLLLEMAADAEPERVVVSGTTRSLTAAQLREGARRAARFFSESDVQNVALLDVNSEAVPLALFGSALAGIPFAPVNYRLGDEQLTNIIQRLAPVIIIAGPDAAARVTESGGVRVVTRDDFLTTCENGPEPDDEAFVDPDEIAVLLFTSGTTGEPKAAVLRHRHLTSYVIGSVEFMGARDDDAQLVSVPPYHIAGIAAAVSSLYGGRRVVYLPGFDADAWVTAVAEHQVTQAMVVPTMLGRILDALDERDVDVQSLRHLSYGGGRMPAEVIERAIATLPDVDFVNAYGLTETSSTIALLGPEDHRVAAASDEPAVCARLRSVGQPLPAVEVEIRDADGTVLPPGERGEIYVRGEQVAGEYLGRSVLTADGWFPTNDAGYLDADGYLYLDGRLDDVIVRGAENLSPGEIEDTLNRHPAVREAAVVGVPDTEWGEAVAAVVVLEQGAAVSAEELQDWTRERLRSAKTPSIVEFRAELPYNETGKLLRRVLRDDLAPGGS